MKFHFDLPWGGHLHYERYPREPMESGKFYALVGLAAAALFVLLLVSSAL